MALAEERERATRLATRVVSLAIAILGVTLVLGGILLVVRGGGGFVFLAILLFLIGAALAALGFFFQLVPFRLAELEQEKRAYDAREREGR